MRNYYDYDDALKAAGAEVLDFVRDGDYQGNWMAYVRYNGQLGFVSGFYGSCEACDVMMEFSCDGDPERLVEIGRDYMDPLMTHEEACNTIKSWFDNHEATKLLAKYAPPVGNC